MTSHQKCFTWFTGWRLLFALSMKKCVWKEDSVESPKLIEFSQIVVVSNLHLQEGFVFKLQFSLHVHTI